MDVGRIKSALKCVEIVNYEASDVLGASASFNYPAPLPDPPQITRTQIECQVKCLSPYKGYGLDKVANMVLQRCFDMIIDHLLYIFRAILKLSIYYPPWRDFNTVVLWKPGKASYEVPKVYHHIALLSTTAKVLMALVAEDIS